MGNRHHREVASTESVTAESVPEFGGGVSEPAYPESGGKVGRSEAPARSGDNVSFVPESTAATSMMERERRSIAS